MTIEYQIYMATPYTTGKRLEINDHAWICVENCTLVGHTIEDDLPVVRGSDGKPMINDNQFLPADFFRTPPKEGQIRAEMIALAAYEKVSPKDVAKKTVTHSNWDCETFTIIFADKTYLKIKFERYYGDVELITDDLTIWDLRQMGILSEADWDDYRGECRLDRASKESNAADVDFRRAIHRVGKERAKELLGLS